MPGVLVEALYLTNPTDARYLADPRVPLALARAYADAIAAYLGPPTHQAVVTGLAGANLRPSPLLATAPLALLPRGAPVELDEIAEGDMVGGVNRWWRVSWQGRAGFVFGRLIQPLAPPSAPSGPAAATPAAPAPGTPPTPTAPPASAPTTRPSSLSGAPPSSAPTDATPPAPAASAAPPASASAASAQSKPPSPEPHAPPTSASAAPSAPPSAPATPAHPAVVRDDGDGLAARLRGAPTQDAPILIRARPGERLEVLGRAVGGPVDGGSASWLKVRRGNTIGWVWAPLLDVGGR
jgi:hypothetical protein